MEKRCLAMFDLSGIQSFIFRTNRLKEIIGASALVSKSLLVNVPDVLGEGPDDWKTRGVDDFRSVQPGEGRIVYIGGGNALVLFGDASAFEWATRSLERMVFEQTGGGLRICSAVVSLQEGERLGEANERLRLALDEKKALSAPVALARGFSLDELDNETYEPVVYFEEPVRDAKGTQRFLPRSRYLKLKEYEAQGRGTGDKSPLFSLLDRTGCQFCNDLDDFFTSSDAKKFTAVVHIDGNTMGQRIRDYLQGRAQIDQSLDDDLCDMRDLSLRISDIYRDTLVRVIEEMYGNQEGAVPFRPVVADGDDITVICRSDCAFELVSRFVAALEAGDSGNADDGLPCAREFSVGAGIAFVKKGYPFSTAYEMAEQLCGSAKKAALSRYGEEGRQGIDGQPPVSSVDFHVCTGELTGDIGEYRADRLTQGSVVLAMRPYHFNAKDDVFAYASFASKSRSLVAAMKASDPLIARSKLKGLRDAYEQGRDFADRYAQTAIARDLALHPARDDEGIRRAECIQELLGEVYDEAPAGVFARYFDALDVMDLYPEGVYSGKEAAHE